MPRRRGARLTTAPKKKGTGKKIGGDPTAPTEKEWVTLPQFGSFIVRDEDDVEHTFKKGDVAAILPHGTDPSQRIELSDYWVARIREIRASSDDCVWTRVQWYWSGKDVKNAIKSFKPETCGKYERIFSDYFDYVSTSAYDAVVPLVRFHENDPDQPYIGHRTFYQRYTFEFQARNIQPKQGLGTCTCSEPFNPNNPSSTEIMHYCPRPSCRKWYHTRCLLEHQGNRAPIPTGQDDNLPKGAAKTKETSKKRTRSQMEGEETIPNSEGFLSAEQRALQLLACSPDLDRSVDIVALIGGRVPSTFDDGGEQESEVEAEDEDDEEEESSSARQVELAILEGDFEPSSSRSIAKSNTRSKKTLESEKLADTWVKRLRSPKEDTPPPKAHQAPSRKQRNTVKATATPAQSTRGSVAVVVAQKRKKTAAPPPVPRRSTRPNGSGASKPIAEGSASTGPVATRRVIVIPANPVNHLITPPPDDLSGRKRKNTSRKGKGKEPQRLPQITPQDVLEYFTQPGSAWDDGVETSPLITQPLLKIAQQPIIRGLAYVEGGVSGNVSVVVKARRRIYQLLNWVGRGRVDDDDDKMDVDGDTEKHECPMKEGEILEWEKHLVNWAMESDLEDAFFEANKRRGKGKTGKVIGDPQESARRSFCCPGCGGPI